MYNSNICTKFRNVHIPWNLYLFSFIFVNLPSKGSEVYYFIQPLHLLQKAPE